MKTQEKRERWKEKKGVKRQKKDDEEVEEEEENVQPVVDPLENGFLHHAQREQERMNERLLKKTYSKKNKMVSAKIRICMLHRRLFFFRVFVKATSLGNIWNLRCCGWSALLSVGNIQERMSSMKNALQTPQGFCTTALRLSRDHIM